MYVGKLLKYTYTIICMYELTLGGAGGSVG